MALVGEIESPSSICVIAENKILLKVDTVLDGLIAVFGVYYTCNYCYCPHVSKTLEFLQKHWMKIATPKVSDSVRDLALYMGLRSRPSSV